jgi:aminoglycoside 3-N-acetyltransferase
MFITRDQFIADLMRLGLKGGDTVMLHASVRAIGSVIGGPDEIHLAVEQAVQPGGTLLMYLGCQDGFDDVGRGCLSTEEEAAVLEHQPAFSFQYARAARHYGMLAEFFRTSPGTHCSRHVGARMAARGARAEWLVADHPWNYGYGYGSPLHKLCQMGGKVLLLGSCHDEVTLLHYVEHVASFDGRRVARYKVPLMHAGARVWVEAEEFDTSSRGVHANWPENFFELIVDDFIVKFSGTDVCALGRVGQADSVLMDANALVKHAIPVMEARAMEPPSSVNFGETS